MRDKKFAVFILSHERAETMTTYVLLKQKKYKGELFIVIDDKDKQRQRYKELYGKSLIVFNMEKEKQEVDTITNKKDRSVVYARNFVSKYANKNGYEYYAMLDDDITNIDYRYIKQNKLKSKPVEDIEKVFDLLVCFMQTNKNIYCVGSAHQGNYVGGANGRYKDGIVFGNVCQIFIFRVGETNWKGLLSNDTTTSVVMGKVGNVFMQLLLLNHNSPERKSNSGGLHESYKTKNDYEIAFYALVCEPSCVKIKVNKKHVPGIMLKRNNAFPKIISGRYKK